MKLLVDLDVESAISAYAEMKNRERSIITEEMRVLNQEIHALQNIATDMLNSDDLDKKTLNDIKQKQMELQQKLDSKFRGTNRQVPIK